MASIQDISITQLKGVGKKLQETLEKLHLHTIQDLIFHLPHRYEDRTRVVALGHFRPGVSGVFEAQVAKHQVTFGKRRSLEVMVKDATGLVVLRFYHFSSAQMKALVSGATIRGFGEARMGRTGLEFYHPEYKIIKPNEPLEIPDTLTAMYPLTEGIQQPRMRLLCENALGYLERFPLAEFLPEAVRVQYQMPPLVEAIKNLHAPPQDADQEALLEGRHVYQQRLALEELLAHYLSLQKARRQVRAQPAARCPNSDAARRLATGLLEPLPFVLTGAQSRVVQEISRDLDAPAPMLRLVQGDVGSGKTLVAALAATQALAAGVQVALMAPTEILAEQHLESFRQWFAPLNISITWLSGKLKVKERRENMALVASGEAQIVIGTHALFQDEVKFKRLGLAIIDEQHRFGVHQRLSLKNKGEEAGIIPHQLVMTATPIPRTLAMSAYADMDTSIIDELPPGRQPIETFALPDTRRVDLVEKVRQICEQGDQAYWVCTLIEESEVLQCQAAEEVAQWLATELSSLKVGLVHGRMKPAEKTATMGEFSAGRIDLLVATTVIEVGVNVPDATLMVIENPERLGLAQLHQLRGRVGRGSKPSYCGLLYHAPLSNHGKERLNVMRESTDGFVIAEKDLEIRGPGEVLGTRQTGVVDFRVADLQRDQQWLTEVRAIAPHLSEQDCEGLIRRWIGTRTQYAEV